VSLKVKVLSKEKDHEMLQIAVTDEGLGITPIQAEKLFQPFIQADNSTTRKYGGTGLGLSLSRKLASKLGGDVVLSQSSPGKGSTFVITISTGSLRGVKFVKRVDSMDKHEEAVSVEGEILSGINVLLVEDSLDNQTLLSHFLTLAGAKVELAENGREAVTSAMKGSFDIVLMDIQMPVLDGYQATRQLRSQAYNKPILALTAHALKEERERCLAAGCDDHLTKPVNREELLKRIAIHHARAESRALH
jgi:CheY-like chemotaxis protein